MNTSPTEMYGLCVDGIDKTDDVFSGSSNTAAPYYVFDIDAQLHIAGPFDNRPTAIKCGQMLARVLGVEFIGEF